MDFGYLRVSTCGQDTEHPLDGVALERRFVDTIGGHVRDRPQLAALLERVCPGDTIHVHSFGRLARSLTHLLELIETITGRGVTLVFHREGLSFEGGVSTTLQRVQRPMLEAVTEIERVSVARDAAENRAAASVRDEGVGRLVALMPVQMRVRGRRARVARAAGESAAAIALDLDVSRPVVYRALVDRAFGDGPA